MPRPGFWSGEGQFCQEGSIVDCVGNKGPWTSREPQSRALRMVLFEWAMPKDKGEGIRHGPFAFRKWVGFAESWVIRFLPAAGLS